MGSSSLDLKAYRKTYCSTSFEQHTMAYHKGMTFIVCEDGNIVMGKFNPKMNDSTAHARLARMSGFDHRECLMGGSVKQDGTIEFRSGTINNNAVGVRDAAASQSAAAMVADIRARILDGDYFTRTRRRGLRFANGEIFYDN